MPSSTRLQLILLGPPGAGKGTQAALIAKRFDVPHISTGDILRAEHEQGSELGRKAKRYMEAGRLVPDDLILGVVRKRLERDDREAGFVFDGFPRSLAQAIGLEEVCEGSLAALRTVSLGVSREEVIKRISGRRTCRSCSTPYHVASDPPSQPGVCDRCGGELIQRDDDRESVVAARLKVYAKETAPLIEFYRARGRLIELDGTGSTEQVFSRIVAALGAAA